MASLLKINGGLARVCFAGAGEGFPTMRSQQKARAANVAARIAKRNSLKGGNGAAAAPGRTRSADARRREDAARHQPQLAPSHAMMPGASGRCLAMPACSPPDGLLAPHARLSPHLHATSRRHLASLHSPDRPSPMFHGSTIFCLCRRSTTLNTTPSAMSSYVNAYVVRLPSYTRRHQ